MSLRLYLLQTLSLYIIWVAIMTTTSYAGNMSSVFSCSRRINNLTSTPAQYMLVGVYMLTRAYILTPIPIKWHDRGRYRLRQTVLQKFVWWSSATGGPVGVCVEPEPFWAVVSRHLGRGEKESRAVRRVSRAMLRKGLSRKALASRELWRGILVEGDFEGAKGGPEGLENDPLFSPVSYGPEPQTLGSQPVFSFSTMAAALWFSKIVYCDGVVPDVKVEVRGLDCWLIFIRLLMARITNTFRLPAAKVGEKQEEGGDEEQDEVLEGDGGQA